jgi:hypothetical protein
VKRQRRIGIGPKPFRLAPQSFQELIYTSLGALDLIGRYL